MSEISDLRAEVSRLRRDMERITAQIRLPENPWMLLSIDKGNTLETGQDGIKYAVGVTSVPSPYDPNVTSSFIDGIGRATLYKNGVAQDGYVLVINSDSGSFRNAMFQNDVLVSTGSIMLPAGGTDVVQVYTA